MPTRADLYPEQATSEMDAAQAGARRTDNARDEAQYRHDRLEEDLNGASPEEEAEAQARFQQAERDLEAVEQEFESAMESIGQLTTFWYEEEVEGDE